MAADTTALQEQLLEALRNQKGERALEVIAEIEQIEGDAPRWPHRRGDLLRRLGRNTEAITAYERAMTLYAKQGFVARSAALAKVVLQIDPARTDVLERVEPEAARKLHRDARQAVVSAAEDGGGKRRKRSLHDVAVPLTRAADAASDEVRFADASVAGGDDVVEIDVAEVEFVEPAPLPPSDDDVEPVRSAEELARFTSTPLFAEIPKEELHRMLLDSGLVGLSPGQPLVRTGDPSDALYVIASGSVEVRVPGMREPIVLGEGQVVGESCLLDGADRRADVVARGQAHALKVPKTVLDRMVAEHPQVGEVMLELLTRRVILNLVRTSPLFMAFDDTTKREVAKMFEVRRAEAGTVLLEEGKRSDGLYILLVGSAERVSSGAQTVPVPRGRAFGERSLLSHAPAGATVRTTTEALLLRLPSAKFTELAALFPPVLEHLTELAAGGYKSTLGYVG